MDVVWWVAYYLLFFLWLLLTARAVVDLVRSYARSWQPVGGVAFVLKSIYTVTDPPVRAVRRVIKPIWIGIEGLDLSLLVLVFVLYILMRVVDPR